MSKVQARKAELAKKWNIKGWEKMENRAFFAEVTKRSTEAADKEAAATVEPVEKKAEAAKETAVTKTEEATTTTAGSTTNTKHEVAVGSPVINMHVPAPTVTIQANKFPGIYAILAQLQMAVLHMIAGASLFALFGRKLLTVAGL